MLRSDFEQNPIWAVVATIGARLDEIRPTASDDELGKLETIGFYRDYIDSFRTSSPQPALFVDGMLSPVHAVLNDVITYLDQRIAQGTDGSSLEAARVTIENALIQIGPWPRPLAKGGQVAQLTTLYEDLLERQRADLELLEERHRRFREDLENYTAQMANLSTTADSNLDNIYARATSAVETVNAEKVRIDEIINDGVKSIGAIAGDAEKRQRAWQTEQQKVFEKRFAPFETSIKERLQAAETAFDSLRKTETAYDNLTAAAGTDRLASHFSTQAKNSRRAGFLLYGIGAVFLLAAATPLFLLLLTANEKSDQDVRIEQIILRVGIALVAAGAATVAIRLGGRFMTDATGTKRMELELRTFGPFLANVADQASVDNARIQLVDRAFGKSYVSAGSESDDAVPVSAIAPLIEAASKLIK